MDTILGQFDTEKYIQYEKEESYTNGYDAGHASGFNEGALDATISFYLKELISKTEALEGSNISEADFDRAVEDYKNRH